MAVPESVEIAAAFDPAFAVEDVAVHTFENAVKVQCMVIPDPDIVSFTGVRKCRSGVPPALF